jgi:hypothetical protein
MQMVRGTGKRIFQSFLGVPKKGGRIREFLRKIKEGKKSRGER